MSLKQSYAISITRATPLQHATCKFLLHGTLLQQVTPLQNITLQQNATSYDKFRYKVSHHKNV